MLSLIVANDLQDGIGLDGKLPWYCPDDMEHFWQTVGDSVLICGRKTWDNLPTKKRNNRIIVMSRRYELAGTWANARNIKDALKLAAKYGNGDAYVVGGAEIFDLFLPYTSRIIQTVFGDTFEVDTTWTFDKTDWIVTKSCWLDWPVFLPNRVRIDTHYPIVLNWERR